MRKLLLIIFAVVSLIGCSRQQGSVAEEEKESREAKAMLQGVWVEKESVDVSFRVKGDTIFYADTTSQLRR